MSFFDRFTSSISLESEIVTEFNYYKNFINQMIEEENQVLRSLGIQPPRLVSECSYTQKPYGEKGLCIRLVPPKFDYQSAIQFTIRGTLIATVFEKPEEIDAFYWWWGLGATINQYPNSFVWTNRSPYVRYCHLEEKPRESISCAAKGDFTKATQGNGYCDQSLHNKAVTFEKPLEAAKSLSVEEASSLHLRVQLYNYVNDESCPFTDETGTTYFYPSTYISDDLIFKMPVAQTRVSIPYSCIKILPSGETTPSQMNEFLSSLRRINHFFSFELVRKGETVYFQLRVPTECEEAIIAKLNLYFPDFEMFYNQIEVPPTNFRITWQQKKSIYNSIKNLREFQLDPYAHFASLFDNLPSGDLLSYQIMFAPLLDESASILERQVTNSKRSFDSDTFNKKLPLWIVSISINTTNESVGDQLINAFWDTLDTPDQNFGRDATTWVTENAFPKLFPNFVTLYDTNELAALAHFPTTELPIERLEKTSMKNVQPPQIYTAGAARIGESKARGQVFPVTLPEEVRDRHVYVVGKSGTGKSTLIEAIARRDIEAGHGVAVIDPHGDLVHHLLETMPEHRVSDCILFSPKHFPVSLEILSAENDHEIDLLSDDLITMFRRTSESWGDKMQAILQMAFQTLLRVPGSSFTDITPLLTDENFRNRILSKIDHPQLTSFWQQRYDMRQAEPILIRMDRLTTSGTLRSVLTQTKNSLNFYDVITESKILLADLSKGFLGESTSHLIGSIIVSQIQLAAMRQAHLPSEQRIPFSLFVDEVQNFTTSAFSTILSEARKQKLRLTIAHQFVSQLPTDLQKAVFGNVGTLVFFALSPDDLGAARHELGTFEPSDVANLPKYHALCRPATAARETFSFATDPPPPLPAKNYTETIIEQTRREYAAQTISKEEPLVTNVEVATSPIAPTANETDLLEKIDGRRPSPAPPLSFPTNPEKIMHFMRSAEYLSQPQIIALTDLLPPNASTALKRLGETGQIKTLDDRRPKIYFIGRTCNPTVHNLLIRDLWVKINASNYAVRSVKFNDQLADLNPDLTVEFLSEDGTPLLAYFELDRGTEGIGELVKKADRYARVKDNPRICFVFEREPDMLLARKTIEYPFITYAVLNQFASLRDSAFYAAARASASDAQLPFFR